MPRTRVTAPLTVEGQNKRTIEEALAADLVKMQAIIDDTNNNINSNPAARIKDMARVHRRLIRQALRSFEGTT
jgi:hypothetical protein